MVRARDVNVFVGDRNGREVFRNLLCPLIPSNDGRKVDSSRCLVSGIFRDDKSGAVCCPMSSRVYANLTSSLHDTVNAQQVTAVRVGWGSVAISFFSPRISALKDYTA